MEEVLRQDKKFNKVAWSIMLFFTLFAAALPGINVPGIGFLYLFRIVLPFLLIYVIINENHYGNYTNTIRDTGTLFLLIIFYGIFSLLWAQNQIEGIKSILNYIYGFSLVFTLLRVIHNKEHLYILIRITGYIMIAIMLIGVFESLTGKYIFSSSWSGKLPYPQYPQIHYPVVCFGNPNDFVFIAFGIFPFFNLALNNTLRNRHRITTLLLQLMYLGLLCLIIVFASNRMGMLLIPFTIVVNLLVSKNNNVRVISWVLIPVIGFIFAIWKWDSLTAFFAEDARIQIWGNILRNAKHYYFMGTGPGNSYLPISGVEYDGVLMNPHFWFLEMFAEFGVIIFVFLIIWYWLIMRRAIKLCSVKDKEISSMGRTAIKFMIYFIPMSVMSSSVSAMPQFWLIISILLLVINVNEIRSTEECKYGEN